MITEPLFYTLKNYTRIKEIHMDKIKFNAEERIYFYHSSSFIFSRFHGLILLRRPPLPPFLFLDLGLHLPLPFPSPSSKPKKSNEELADGEMQEGAEPLPPPLISGLHLFPPPPSKSLKKKSNGELAVAMIIRCMRMLVERGAEKNVKSNNK